MKKKFFIILLSVLLVFGCKPTQPATSNPFPEAPKTEISSVSEEVVDIKENTSVSVEIEPLESISEEELPNSDMRIEFALPSYSGEPFVYINDNKPFFTKEEITDKSYESYSPLDDLGRVGPAMCCCGTDLFPDRDRGDISMVYPTGWKQGKYDFIDNEGWLYNRCHLIAYCLTGIDGENEEDIPLLERNLFTGTRNLNIYGMWAIEETVYYYLIDNPENHVMYRVTPMFEGDELLCRGVLMEAYSVEDEGKGCQFCVFCFNVEDGVEIDYRTGENNEE